jgi:hypothetical protein
MKTNEEILDKYSTWYVEYSEGEGEMVINLQDCRQAIQEAQKEIVEYILQKAANNAQAKQNHDDYGTGEIWIDEKSILSLKDEIIKELGL